MTTADNITDITESTEEGGGTPTLSELLRSCTEGETSLHPNTELHDEVERLLTRRAEIRDEMARTVQPKRKLELRQELANLGRRLTRLGVPKEIRRAR